MDKLNVYVVGGDTPATCNLYLDREKAERAASFHGWKINKEFLICDCSCDTLPDFAYKAYNGSHTDWYLSEYQAMAVARRSTGKEAYFIYNGLIRR